MVHPSKFMLWCFGTPCFMASSIHHHPKKSLSNYDVHMCAKFNSGRGKSFVGFYGKVPEGLCKRHRGFSQVDRLHLVRFSNWLERLHRVGWGIWLDSTALKRCLKPLQGMISIFYVSCVGKNLVFLFVW